MCKRWGLACSVRVSSIGRTPVLMPNLGISFNFELFFSMKKLMPGLGISFNRFSALNLVYLTPWGGFRFRQVYDPRYQAGAGATREHTHSGHQVCPCQTRVTPVYLGIPESTAGGPPLETNSGPNGRPHASQRLLGVAIYLA